MPGIKLSMLYESNRVRYILDKAIKKKFGSQKAAADALGINNSALSRYKRLGNGSKNCRRFPSLEVLMKIKKLLGNKAYEALLTASRIEILGN